ncbi:MAG: hypothetical protein Q9184_007371 [Pyrenodesmia sp. 2 TL-2023]
MAEEDHYRAHSTRMNAFLKSGGFKEAQEAKINLPDDDPAALRRMLSYLYTTGYDDEDHVDEWKENGSSKAMTLDTVADHVQGEATSTAQPLEEPEPARSNVSALMNNVLVYALAEKYDIQSLKDLAKEKFELRSATPWEEDNLIAVAELVYTATPATDRGLRDVIAWNCSKHIDRSDGQFLQSSKLEELCTKDGALPLNVLKWQHDRNVDLEFEMRESEVSRQIQDKTTADLPEWVQRLQKDLKSAMERVEGEVKTLKDQLATTKKHAAQEQAAFKALILKDTSCRHCNEKLTVAVREPTPYTEDRHVYLRCVYCCEILETVRCG